MLLGLETPNLLGCMGGIPLYSPAARAAGRFPPPIAGLRIELYGPLLLGLTVLSNIFFYLGERPSFPGAHLGT